MKFSYQWIRELVNGLEASPAELEKIITIKTAECEGIVEAGVQLEGSSTACILRAEPMDGGHLTRTEVETARYGTKTVVCGAPNCRPGMTTVYLPVGRKIIQGVESDGMLASAAELGINRDHTGIVEIHGEFKLTPDSIIEIDNKSITHRPDLWGHLGMAREVAAIFRTSLRDPVRMELLPEGPAAIGVAIEDFDMCPRYSALVFDNVKVGPSPLWLQYRLESIGLNSINNIVDFTNLVMAELGQPTHAFDRALLQGGTIFIRPARAGERCLALNGEEYELTPANCVIADASGAVAIAGVIGGNSTAISGSTTSIVLESANFNAASIRRTSAALKLRTDASMRFEKAQDPENTTRALARAVELLPAISPGIRLVGGVADVRRAAAPAPAIRLPLDWLARKLGRTLPVDEVRGILERLSFGTTRIDENVLEVRVPSWRATKDISIKEDLVEEVGRMIGYDSITPVAPLVPAGVPPASPERLFHRGVRAMMAAQGYTEVSNYSFVSEEQARALGMDPAGHVAVANPISSDQSLMRRSLLPGIRKNILDNSRHFDSFKLFEIGREIRPGGKLPVETPFLAAAVYAKDDGVAGLLELKRAAECLMPGAAVKPAEARDYEHPARAADVEWRGEAVGRLFEFHPGVIEDGRGAVLYVNLETMFRLTPAEKRYQPQRRYPSSEFDLSVIAGLRELAGDLEGKLRGYIDPVLLERIEYLRQYSGAPLPDGVKSVSFRLRVSSPDKTLSSDEVAQIRAGIIEGMHGLGYELRV